MIFDSHAHFDDRAFDEDREELLSSLPSQGISYVVNVGASKSTTENTLTLTQKYDYIYGAAGVHPTDTDEYENGLMDLKWLKTMATQPKMQAIGEIGLDYHWDTPDRPIQKKWFEAQLSVAKELDKPVIIHSRDAAQDTLDIIRASGGRDMSMVIHCFSYGVEMAREYLNMGYYLGVGGVVTYKNGRKLKEVVEYMPLSQMLLETDCPYLTPVPHRGKRNSSLYLPLVLEEIAALKGTTPEEVARITKENALKFYRISQN